MKNIVDLRRDRPRAEAKKLLRITGLPAVAALFATAPGRVEKLFFEREAKSLVAGFCAVLAHARKPYRLVGPEELARVAGTILHGGIVAVARPRPLTPFDPEEASAWAHEGRLLLLLDGVGNPHNFGAIARTAVFFGLPRIVLSDHPAQALPSDASYRVAEGGLEHVALYRAAPFVPALGRLRRSHLVVGAAAEGGRPIGTLKRSDRPFALVLGNEETGPRPATLKACDEIVTIPGSGSVQSLNVAASAAILIYAMAAGRD
jgi:RNA methyltransferase, TrmH family